MAKVNRNVALRNGDEAVKFMKHNSSGTVDIGAMVSPLLSVPGQFCFFLPLPFRRTRCARSAFQRPTMSLSSLLFLPLASSWRPPPPPPLLLHLIFPVLLAHPLPPPLHLDIGDRGPPRLREPDELVFTTTSEWSTASSHFSGR